MKSPANAKSVLLLATFLAATSGVLAEAAGELVLRSHCVPGGPIVRLGDVAEATTGDDATRKQLLEAPLMPAPAPGTQQRIGGAQLRDMLSANGIDASMLRFVGADVVVVEGPARAIEPAPAAAEKAPQLTDDAAEQQILTELNHFLRRQTGHELWSIELEPNAPLMAAFRGDASRPTVSGGKAPWTGRQRFMFAWSGDTPALGAMVRVERLELVACAVRTIERGDFVRATDVVLRPVGGAVPARSVGSLDAAIGKEAVQTIRADSVLLANQLRAPILVRRGERVEVRARATGVVVLTYATARQDGGLGDLILVEALEGREKYAARVSGARKAEVFAAGAEAGEIAAATTR